MSLNNKKSLMEEMIDEKLEQNEQIIQKFESKYPQTSKAFKRIQSEQYLMFTKKALDYGLDNITLGASLDKEENVKFILTLIWVRVMDKINRLKNLVIKNKQPNVKQESILDNWKDISNYSIIAQLIMSKEWEK